MCWQDGPGGVGVVGPVFVMVPLGGVGIHSFGCSVDGPVQDFACRMGWSRGCLSGFFGPHSSLTHPSGKAVLV